MLGLKVQDNADFSAEIIRRVREHETLSRVELARVLGVAASTIGRHVDSLVDAGYFTETVEPTKEAGRPPTRLRPVAEKGCFLGVDFHSQHLFGTVMDFAQKELHRLQRPLNGPKGAESVVGELSTALRELATQAKLPVLAVGIGVPGQVHPQRGLAVNYKKIPGFENFPLAARLREVTGSNVFLQNNVRAMALAEKWFGEGRGVSDMICLGVRIGVNAAIVRDGSLAIGHNSLGGEIRGWNCPAYDATKEKWEWSPGTTVEDRASVPAAVARFAELRGKPATQAEFLAAAKAGDAKALLTVREVAAIHGWIISQMSQIADPEIVVLAGPFTTLGDAYLDVVKSFAAQFESEYHKAVPIVTSALGDLVGAIGAAALAMERWRPADMG